MPKKNLNNYVNIKPFKLASPEKKEKTTFFE